MNTFDELAEKFDTLYIINEETKCWIWVLSPNNAGYGNMVLNGERWLAHRLSYHLNIGDIPENLEVLHKCDVRLCVNPEHLFLGTQKDNLQDCINKGRNSKGIKNGMAKLTDEKILEIRYKGLFIRQHILAKEYHVSQSLISKILSYELWPDL